MRIMSWLSQKGGPVALVSALTIGAGFMACSSDAENETAGAQSTSTGTGGTGNTGNTGNTTTGTTASSSSTVASSSASTGGLGGGSPCDMACQKLNSRCGLGDVCSMPQVQQFLDCSNPNSDCPGQCILDESCADITDAVTKALNGDLNTPLLMCIQTCQGGQGGAGGGGGGQTCTQCGTNSCIGPGGACLQDNDCQPWLQCLQGCQDSACVANCTAMNPNAAPLSTDVLTCLCTNCDGECSALDPCGNGSGGSGQGGAGGAGGN